jgi:mRNA interferase RelE/StbE
MSSGFKVKLTFKKLALEEWNSIPAPIREKFKKALAKRMESLDALTMPKNRLSLKHNCYKIKLKNDGYRLAYTVRDDENGEVSVVVSVVAVDRRDEIYNELKKRLDADV